MGSAIISIVTGIIVFIITWPLNNYLSKKTSKKEYFERVNNANNKVIEILKDYIISFNEISINVIDQIILAEKIEFNIDDNNMYNLMKIKATLTRDFIEIRLIPDDQRKKILKIIEDIPDDETKLDIKELNENRIKKSNDIKILTTMMSFIVMITTILSMILILQQEKSFYNTRENITITFASLFITVACAEATVLLIIKERKKKKNIIKGKYEKKEKKNSIN